MAKREKSDIVSGLGTAFQIVKKLRDGGASDEELRRLLREDDLVKKVVSMLRITEITGQRFPSLDLAADLIPEGWTVIEDVVQYTFRGEDLKFKSFLHDDESRINGDTMCQRAVSLRGNLGLVEGKFLLDHQDEIPEELHNCYIVLPGTVLRDPDGSLGVPCLDFGGDCWRLGFGWLDDDWDDSGRFACSK